MASTSTKQHGAAQAPSQKYSNLALFVDKPRSCPLFGKELLDSPEFNKGSAFPAHERDAFGLHGLLPSNVQTLAEQAKRAYQQYKTRADPLAKNTFMTSMKEQNEVLYYKLIMDHLKEMMGIIYTPTEGDAIQNYSRVFRRSDGCFLSIEDGGRESVERAFKAQERAAEDVDYIVVSDGEEILGIGDQGVGGVLISVAKLVLMTVCAGIHPSRTIPVVLDCGTDNEELLNDDLYLGLKRPRVRGEKYDQFVDHFVQTARKMYPKAYIHFEDFGLQNARRLLDRYRPQIACFNDDVQGTGCVTLAAVQAALKVAEINIKDARVVIFGSGTAGTGIADMIRDAIATDSDKDKDEATKQIWCVDKPGLLLQSMGDDLTQGQKVYARAEQGLEGKNLKSLLDVIKEVKPHVLIGTSTKPKTFTEEVVKEMAKHSERPIIFPLSNPTRLHEADPHDILEWTDGKALVSTGSPFPPAKIDGRNIEIAECNNSTCFPGIGLGAVLSRAKLCSDKMLVEATKALAAQSPALKGDKPDADKGLLPDVVDAREISVHIAKAVIKTAVSEGLAQEKGIPENDDELDEWIRAQMWDPVYRHLVKPGEQADTSKPAEG